MVGRGLLEKLCRNRDEFIEHLLSTQREGVVQLTDWLRTTDFFHAPGSERYHNVHTGGLVKHSLEVFQLLMEKNVRYGLGFTLNVMIIVALLHDLDKIGRYTINRSKDGVVGWRARRRTVADPPHGFASLLIVKRFIQLSDEESMAIVWHMGAWHTRSREHFRLLNKACRTYPLVMALISADYEAAKLLKSKSVEVGVSKILCVDSSTEETQSSQPSTASHC